METKMNYYSIQKGSESGEYLAVIKAHSGYEALGYYWEEKNDNGLLPDDIYVRKIHIPEVSRLRAAGVPYFDDLSY
ncbi:MULTISPECIES: hypothetical protein [Bacillus cereus group]|uniref:hypothetical protein n=1 Tax=Bacillus cereus group TaxID=86661 RepID=UPI0022E407CB|nr:hypothetical protein [Bacillus cereus group sp. TH152-1LC]MDA1675212.1 hypothetical protein [Bacillus cereus group sp. TH152-1LC]